MEPFRYHVYVCDQRKPEGAPCCRARGSAKVIDAFRAEIARQGLTDQVQVTVCGSLGLCERGPNMVVYPEGVWYSSVTPDDVREIVRSHFQQGLTVTRLANPDPSALHSEIAGNREKMLAALKAADAAGFPPEDLMQTITAFQESRAVLTAIELDVFSAVGEGATATEVASRLGTDARATEMLLNALVAMELLAKTQGVFCNTPVAAHYLVDGSPASPRTAWMHTVNLWRRWSTLTDCVRAGTSVTYQEMEERGPEWTEAFIAAMHRNATFRAPQVVKAVGTEGVKRLLDVGGGSGAHAIAFARASETLRVDLLDLPSVLSIAQQHINEAGLADRIHTRAGDLRTDDFGEGYDLVFISAICHMLSPEENQDLFRRSFRALTPGGRIAVQDFILNADRTSPHFAALFALNMLVGTRQGSSYSEDEYTAWLQAAGFHDVQRITLPGPANLLVGKRP